MNYLLTIYPALEDGNPNITFKFETKEELVAARETCADLLLFMQDQAQVMPSYSNSFIIEEFINNEWVEFS